MLSRYLIAIGVAVVALFIISTVAGSRIAAGAGALMLLAGIVYAFVQNKRGSSAQVEQAERGAVRLREELEREDSERAD